jgi:hypothetical protein
VKDFIKRNLGDEVFERLIEPFCSGVYAGDPSKLSMQAAFQRVSEQGLPSGPFVQLCILHAVLCCAVLCCAVHKEPGARSSC